jgi:hypothetical protein
MNDEFWIIDFCSFRACSELEEIASVVSAGR